MQGWYPDYSAPIVRNAPDGVREFGSAFQNYVGAVLNYLLKPPTFTVTGEQAYQVAKGYRKHGVDWTVCDATANVFVECKTKRLRQDAKFIIAGTGLNDAMDALGGYVVQHYKNITDALDGKTAWKPNALPSFALIVTLEDWWIFTPPIVSMLDESIKKHLAETSISEGILKRVPYVVASIDEVELGCQVMAETGIAPFLSLKTDADHHGWALSPFATSEFPEQAKRMHRRLFADEFLDFGTGLADEIGRVSS